MKIENTTVVQQTEDWRPGVIDKEIGEFLINAIEVLAGSSNRRDAARTERHADPSGFDCPAMALMGIV